jgi:L-glyceraldehyde 3-phosphate reductase
MFNRWIEHGLLDVLEADGVGCITFSPLAQGLLTTKYLNGVPDNSRVRSGIAFDDSLLTEENLERVRALNEIASGRGQTLAQMALAWTLRDPRVTSTLVGVSRLEQLEDNLGALDKLEFSHDELVQIDRYAHEGKLNLWAGSASIKPA